MLDNYNKIQSRYTNKLRAAVDFKRKAQAYRRIAWSNYRFEPEKVSLLEDMGYRVQMPLIDVCGEIIKLSMHYSGETEEGKWYSIHMWDYESCKGVIIHDTNETTEEFFERFVGEVFYFTTVKDENYFPFVEEVRSQFNFKPAFVSIDF